MMIDCTLNEVPYFEHLLSDNFPTDCYRYCREMTGTFYRSVKYLTRLVMFYIYYTQIKQNKNCIVDIYVLVLIISSFLPDSIQNEFLTMQPLYRTRNAESLSLLLFCYFQSKWSYELQTLVPPVQTITPRTHYATSTDSKHSFPPGSENKKKFQFSQLFPRTVTLWS